MTSSRPHLRLRLFCCDKVVDVPAESVTARFVAEHPNLDSYDLPCEVHGVQTQPYLPGQKSSILSGTCGKIIRRVYVSRPAELGDRQRHTGHLPIDRGELDDFVIDLNRCDVPLKELQQ
jgi:hypothetical protein